MNDKEKFYKQATEKELFDLTLNGDYDACFYYVEKRLLNGTVNKEDIKHLEAGIENLNCLCANLGAIIFGLKNGIYKDEEKEFFCYAVAEQEGYSDAHKKLDKAYKKHFESIDKADERILGIKFVFAAMGMKDVPYSFTAEAVKADKSVPGYKTAYSVNLRYTEQNGRETDTETVYTAYLRGKDRDGQLKKYGDAITKETAYIAGKKGIKVGDVYIDGKRFSHYAESATVQNSPTGDEVKIVSDAGLDIKLSEEGRLKSRICPFCGGALDENGYCAACGKKSDGTETGGIIIRKGKATEALICTQCGHPVILDNGGKTAYCPACGTTFAVNGNALTYGAAGLNYESIKADMPDGETLPDVRFIRAEIGGGSITAVMPESFAVMPDKYRRIKYPSNAPRYIYMTPDATVNFNLNFLGPLEEDEVFAFGGQMLGALKQSFPTAKFGEAKQLTSPRNLFFVDFITAAVDQPIYNAMFFFSFDGKQGVGSWNCLGKDRWFWAPIFEHAVRTMEFNDRR